MTCSVYVYDDNLRALRRSPIALVASNQNTGVTLDSTVTAPAGPEALGKLRKLPANAVCLVYAHDPSAQYAPSQVENLNGKLLKRVDMVLYRFPGAPTGPTSGDPPFIEYFGAHSADAPAPDPELTGDPPETLGDVEAFIQQQPWKASEKEAVRQLVRTFSRLPPTVDNELRHFKRAWEAWLDVFRIDPKLFKAKEKVRYLGR